MSAAFRCAAASADRDEDLAGSASTARGFLLLECPGPWGEDALRQNRMPADVLGPVRARAARLGLRMLLVRRPGRPRPAPEGPPQTTVYAGYAAGARSWLETTRLKGLHGLADLDLEALAAGRTAGLPRTGADLLLVCTHGRHDVCCAERGRPVAAELATRFPEQTWEVSHIGGDRFAANLLVLGEGLYFGRLDAASAVHVAQRLAAGELPLEQLRGRSSFGFPTQAAEIMLRRELGERGRRALRLRQRTTAGELTTAVFARGEALWRVQVASTRGPAHPLTCRATTSGRAWRHRLVDVRPLDGPALSAPG